MAKKQTVTCQPATAELQQEMYRIGQKLKDAYERFNWADDPDLIEACIFEVNAYTARYNYLLRRIKERSGTPIHRMHAYPVTQVGTQSIPCVAAANVKGGNTWHS